MSAPLSRRSALRRVGVVFAAAAALASLAVPAIQADDGPGGEVVQLVRVDTPTWEDRDRLTNLGLDLTEHGGDDFVEVVLHGADDIAVLRRAGFTWTVEVPDLGELFRANRALDAAYAASVESSPLPSGRTAYRTLDDYNAELDQLAADHPDLVAPLTLPHTSVEGREIKGIEITTDPENTSDGKPVFLLMGLHHAREWPSGEHAMEFAYDLIQRAGSDPAVADLVARTRTIVVPVVNPDGFHLSRTMGELFDHRVVDDTGDAYVVGTLAFDAYKRRNCRIVDGLPSGENACFAPGARLTGVDLNRNYGGNWGGGGASAFPTDDIYRGPAPFSEPETQNIRELVSSRQVTMLITNHTFSRLVLRPPGIRAQGTTPDEPALKALGAAMSGHNGYKNDPGWALYDTSGTTEDWSYTATGGFGYTFEIGDEFHPPFPEVIDEYLGTGSRNGLNNQAAYFTALAAAADPALHSVITGDASGDRVLRLTKEFTTMTSPVRHGEGWLVNLPLGEGDAIALDDRLETTFRVGAGAFSWHVNPSTRPAVMERRIDMLGDDPIASGSHANGDPSVLLSDTDIPFEITEAGDMLQVNLEWGGTPDDYDLYLYKVGADGELTEVGVSGNIPGEPEEILLDNPETGQYVARVHNFAAANPSWTLTWGLYETENVQLNEGTTERWTLTCEDLAGNVLATTEVFVDRGQAVKADLDGC